MFSLYTYGEKCPAHWRPYINKTNVLTNFHDGWAKIVTSRVLTREKCPAHWQPYINKTNVLTNFHDDWAKIVTSRVFTRKTVPPTGGHTSTVFTSFELCQDFIGTKLTKFHEDETRNVASRVFTSKCLRTDGRTDIRRTKTGHKSSPVQSVFDPARPIFELDQDIVSIQLLTKFHKDRMKTI
ncbi:hypothetical protein DPMN_067667 [Dreissena polymorpha]|uniref:Uncharacterized protein n=1 Tax=Dreissena polymorpha TaxID=45954 RepID=A0A9D3YW68_DREPO|nr:hypothetical protein DPMN_067667 [Dreissena polymorpha]